MPAHDPTVRFATTADASLLAELGRRTFVQAFGRDNDSDHIAEYVAGAFSIERLTEELADPDAHFIIASIDDRPVGYAKIGTGSAPECVAATHPIELERIYVEWSSIGTGVGSTLMKSSLDAARARGGDVLWLGVWEKNQRAIRFYERWDFEIVGEKEFALGRDTQRDVVMVRRLNV